MKIQKILKQNEVYVIISLQTKENEIGVWDFKGK